MATIRRIRHPEDVAAEVIKRALQCPEAAMALAVHYERAAVGGSQPCWTQSHLLGWMYIVLTNVDLENIRKSKIKTTISIDDQSFRGRAIELPDPGASPQEQALRNEGLLLLHECISRLSKHQKYAIRRTYYDGAPAEEISIEIGVRPGTVFAWLTRARKKLKKCLLDKEKSRGPR